jgi:hypothetical protein
VHGGSVSTGWCHRYGRDWCRLLSGNYQRHTKAREEYHIDGPK